MNPNLVLELVELAVQLAQTHLDSGDTEQALLEITRKAVQAYEDHTGETLDLSQIRAEEPV